jgi:hypothetical protein
VNNAKIIDMATGTGTQDAYASILVYHNTATGRNEPPYYATSPQTVGDAGTVAMSALGIVLYVLSAAGTVGGLIYLWKSGMIPGTKSGKRK